MELNRYEFPFRDWRLLFDTDFLIRDERSKPLFARKWNVESRLK